MEKPPVPVEIVTALEDAANRRTTDRILRFPNPQAAALTSVTHDNVDR